MKVGFVSPHTDYRLDIEGGVVRERERKRGIERLRKRHTGRGRER